MQETARQTKKERRRRETKQRCTATIITITNHDPWEATKQERTKTPGKMAG